MARSHPARFEKSDGPTEDHPRTVTRVPRHILRMKASPFNPRDLLAESRLGVLATIKQGGLPQLSPVMPFYARDAGAISCVDER